MTSKLGALVNGLSWSYASQVSTVVLQFGYAAATTRLVSAGGFGTYAVALTVAGFVSLLASGGLGQSVARMIVLDTRVLGGLATYSLILGVAGSSILFFTSGLWADLWGDEAAETVIQILCVSLLVAPQIGLNAGMLRREGRFKQLAIASFVSNMFGMVGGVALVVHYKNAESLVASPVIAQLLLFLICTFLTRGILVRFRSVRSARSDIGFSTNVIVSSVLSYLASNLGKWSVSRWLGASVLGQWNRADVVTTVPFFQIQTAIVQVVYPEFRHDRDNSVRARRIWPDLLTLVAWACVPAAGFAAALLPEMVPVLFGQGWGVAGDLVAPLVVIAAVQVVTTVLGGAVEALGKFVWIWSSQVLMILIQIAGIAFTVTVRSLVPAIVAFGLVVVARQAVYIFLCHRAGYLNARVLLINYAWIGLASLSAFGIGLLVSASFGSLQISIITVVLVSALVLCSFRWRKFLPPFRILNTYRSGRLADPLHSKLT